MSVQFGRWNFEGQAPPRQYIEKVNATLAPYGPDTNESYSKGGAELGSNLDPSTSLFTLSTARPCSSGIACKKISRVVSSAECPNNACIVPFRVPTQSTIVAWLASEDAK